MERAKPKIGKQSSEAKYRRLFETMTEGVALHEIVFDKLKQPIDYKITEVNPAFEKITGLKKKDVEGKRAAKVFAAVGAPYLDVYAKVALTGESTSYEAYFAPADRYFTVSVFSPETGKLAAVFTDITERERTAEKLTQVTKTLESRVKENTKALRDASKVLRDEINERKRAVAIAEAQNKQLNDVLDMLPAYLVLLSSDYRVPFANRFFRERFGESNGKRCFEYLFHRTEPCEVCETYKVLTTNSPLEWEWVGPDGHNYYIYDFPFVDRDDTRLIMEVGIDITEQKNAQKAITKALDGLELRIQERTRELKESEENFRRIVETANEGIWTANPDGKTTFINQKMADMLGYTREETIDRIDAEFLVEGQQSLVAKMRQEIKESRNFRCEFHFRRKDGTTLWTLANGTALFSEDRENIGSLYMHTDITELKRTQKQLIDYERLAAIGKVSGSIAHEVRNPLAVIDSSVFYLKKILPAGDERVNTHLIRMSAAIHRCTGVIEALLKLTHPKEIRLGSVDLKELVDEVVTESVPSAVKVSRQHVIGVVTVRGDAEQLRIACRNIVTNAVQTMSEGGTLTVGIAVKDNTAVVLISDTGAGIPPENLTRIFEPLFTTKAKGTGLGLSIAKAIIELHQGAISVESEPGRGTTFTITLPLSVSSGAA